MKLAPGCRRRVENEAPLFERKGVAAPVSKVVDVKGAVAAAETDACPRPNKSERAQQHIARQGGPRDERRELVDLNLNRTLSNFPAVVRPF